MVVDPADNWTTRLWLRICLNESLQLREELFDGVVVRSGRPHSRSVSCEEDKSARYGLNLPLASVQDVISSKRLQVLSLLTLRVSLSFYVRSHVSVVHSFLSSPSHHLPSSPLYVGRHIVFISRCARSFPCRQLFEIARRGCCISPVCLSCFCVIHAFCARFADFY